MLETKVFFTASMLTGVPGLGTRKGGERCQESDSPHRLVSVEVFMEDFMILNIINFADIARRENDGVS